MGASTTSTNGRVRRGATEWKALMKRFEESGRTGAEFCRAEGIPRSSFDVWRRKLKGQKPVVAPKKQAEEFVELQPVGQIGGWLVEIELPDGTLARVRM